MNTNEITQRIDTLIADDDDCAKSSTLRALMIAICNDTPIEHALAEIAYDAEMLDTTIAPELAHLIESLLINEYARESLTEIALSLSLCPLHFIDYAICFDDNDAECAQIRMIHPSHDT
jgi:hypothetical protein